MSDKLKNNVDVALSKDIIAIPGVKLGVTAAQIKKPDRKDLVLIEVSDKATVRAAFTQNRFCAAPVQMAKDHLETDTPRWLLINTVYANAGLGAAGLAAAQACCDAVAELTTTPVSQILPFSTGVIGEPLPVDRVRSGLPNCLKDLSESPDAWQSAAEGIMTTDTRPKVLSASASLPDAGGSVCVTGMAKGAGMICPNMATMLGFIAVNQAVSPDLAQQWLQRLLPRSFNAITVDGDTSTNDAVVLICVGDSVSPITTDEDPRAPATFAALMSVFQGLAQAIVRDGEGATKFVTITVKGGGAEEDCQAIARTIAHSPLVKTALFASDPNWGRVLAAVGRAPVAELNIDSVAIWLNDVLFVKSGGRVADYDEAMLTTQMQKETLELVVSVGDSDYEASIWTTDLSHDYVTINAEYRS
jgi:glutamate N-acetyltransferase/amino-acid N-acetyltransferase